MKAPSGPEVTGRFAGLGGVVRAETVARARPMGDNSPGGRAVTVPLTVVVYLAASAGGKEPPPQVVSSNAVGNRNNGTERNKIFLSRKCLAAIFAGGG